MTVHGFSARSVPFCTVADSIIDIAQPLMSAAEATISHCPADDDSDHRRADDSETERWLNSGLERDISAVCIDITEQRRKRKFDACVFVMYGCCEQLQLPSADFSLYISPAKLRQFIDQRTHKVPKCHVYCVVDGDAGASSQSTSPTCRRSLDSSLWMWSHEIGLQVPVTADAAAEMGYRRRQLTAIMMKSVEKTSDPRRRTQETGLSTSETDATRKYGQTCEKQRQWVGYQED